MECTCIALVYSYSTDRSALFDGPHSNRGSLFNACTALLHHDRTRVTHWGHFWSFSILPRDTCGITCSHFHMWIRSLCFCSPSSLPDECPCSVSCCCSPDARPIGCLQKPVTAAVLLQSLRPVFTLLAINTGLRSRLDRTCWFVCNREPPQMSSPPLHVRGEGKWQPSDGRPPLGLTRPLGHFGSAVNSRFLPNTLSVLAGGNSHLLTFCLPPVRRLTEVHCFTLKKTNK